MENAKIGIHVVLMILALVCFLLAAFEVRWVQSNPNLTAAGLFFWALNSFIT